MDTFWLDPNGQLFRLNYWHTRQMVCIEEGDPRYSHDKFYLNYQMVPTGERGKVEVAPLTCYAEVYPERYDGPWETWPTLRIHLRHGKLQDFTEMSRT